MNNKKVLLIQKYIPHYRIKIFEELSKHVELSIIYSAESLQGVKDYSNLKIKRVGLIKIPKIGYYHKCFLKRIASQYDAVIVPIDSSIKSVERLRRAKKRKFKLISWGIGVLADRENRYDSNNSKDAEFVQNIKNSDAAVFYSAYPVNKYSRLGIPSEKMFVANNTIAVTKRNVSFENKNKIIFLGSLYRVKKVDVLVDMYIKALEQNHNLPDLLIIGDGEMKEQLISKIDNAPFKNKIQLLGEITDDDILFEYFQQSIACFSPNQAGLSVLQSMAYGVPFVTSKDSITGGEIFNIKNGVNGVLFSNVDEMVNIILDVAKNKEKYIEMGKNAYNFYWSSRTPDLMVRGFIESIDYALKK